MQIAAIVRQIDAEIEKLSRARAILAELAGPPSPRKSPRRRAPEPAVEAVAAPPRQIAPPQVTVLPPKTKREYRRAPKTAAQEPRALAAAVPAKPVFVPRAAATVPSELIAAPVVFNSEAAEAALRQAFFSI